MFTIENQWCVIELEDHDGPITVYGPYPNKSEAIVFMDEYNKEYDGSPWRAILRPLTRTSINAENTDRRS